ncbi:MAG: hypothetical protein O9345_12615 [Burkholderiaceae bacterium]|jgi:D-galactarolactone cycloisomerase|nr:hypothetical protein [Burkholderiales bacterium]MCZ8338972.1 hypothetical protein [Burkholderiaceae bacterium]
MDILALRVDTDAGLSGWGQACGGLTAPATRLVIELQVAPLAIGRGGPVTFALSGLGIALWDIAGKAAGLPLHRLLGGAVRREITAYASLLAYHDAALVERNAVPCLC